MPKTPFSVLYQRFWTIDSPGERRDGEHADVGGVLRDVEAPARVDDEHRDDYHQVEADRPASRLQDEHDADDAQRERVGGVGERPEQPGDRFEEREHLLDRPAGVEAEHAHVLDLLEVRNEVGHREERDGDENQVRGRDPVEVGVDEGPPQAVAYPLDAASDRMVGAEAAPDARAEPDQPPSNRPVAGRRGVHEEGEDQREADVDGVDLEQLERRQFELAVHREHHLEGLAPRGEPQLEGREGDADGGHGDGEPPRMDRLRSISWRIASVSVSSSGSPGGVPSAASRGGSSSGRSESLSGRSESSSGRSGSSAGSAVIGREPRRDVAAIVERSVRWIRTDRASVRFTRS